MDEDIMADVLTDGCQIYTDMTACTPVKNETTSRGDLKLLLLCLQTHGVRTAKTRAM